MQVYNITYNSNSYPAGTRVGRTRQQSNLKNSTDYSPVPTYKREISNLCYRPFFTANEPEKEVSGKDVKRLKNYIKYRLRQMVENHILEDVDIKDINERVNYINKYNFEIAEKYFHKFIIKRDTFQELEGFKYITPENAELTNNLYYVKGSGDPLRMRFNDEIISIYQYAELDYFKDFIVNLCKKKRDYNLSIRDIVEIIDELSLRNIDLANAIIDNDYKINFILEDNYLIKILDAYKRDKLSGIAKFYSLALRNNKKVPKELDEKFQALINEDDARFLKQLFDLIAAQKGIYSYMTMSEITSQNIELAKYLFSYKKEKSFMDYFKASPLKPRFNYENGLIHYTPAHFCKYLLQCTDARNKDFVKELLERNYPLKKQPPQTDVNIMNLTSVSQELGGDVCKKLIFDGELSADQLVIVKALPRDCLAFLAKHDVKNLIDRVDKLQTTMLKHPDLYVSDTGDDDDDDDDDEFSNDITEEELLETRQEEINDFLTDNDNKNYAYLVLLASILDKEALDNLMRRRLDYLGQYICDMKNVDLSQLALMEKLNNCVNQDGKPFMPSQKVEFMYLLKAYNSNEMSTEKLENMIEAGKVNLPEIHIDLFKQVMTNMGLSEENVDSIPLEKLLAWDMDYIHLLANSLEGDNSENLEIVIELANKYNFKEKILEYSINYTRYFANKHNSKEKILEDGARSFYLNQQNIEVLNGHGIDFDRWYNLPENLNVRFTTKDKNLEKLQQISDQIVEDMNALRSMPVRIFIDKQFQSCIVDDKFSVPEKYQKSKQKLGEFCENILKKLDSVWRRAELNLNNPQKYHTAQKTMTIKNHLEQRLDDINKVSDSKATKNLDWTIRMWDRYPQKDLFQGNYSTCCIGMGECNATAMSDYLTNVYYNMIEIKDNVTGKVVGNALCYFAKDVTDENNEKVVFIIDNIEIKNSVKSSANVGEKLRDSIFEYAKNVVKYTTGRDDMKIYLGINYNDVPTSDMVSELHELTLLNDLPHDISIYMDVFDGWTSYDEFPYETKLFSVKKNTLTNPSQHS